MVQISMDLVYMAVLALQLGGLHMKRVDNVTLNQFNRKQRV
jgi:hypothetical protein